MPMLSLSMNVLADSVYVAVGAKSHLYTSPFCAAAAEVVGSH